MKTSNKTWMLAVILILCGTAMNAQEYQTRHDLSISWGSGSNSELINLFEDVISYGALASAGSDYKTENEKSSGSFSLEYTYHVSRLVGVGAVVAFGHRTHDLFIDGTAQGKLKNRYYTLMPAVKFDWLRTPHFGLYSKLAAGITCRVEKGSDIDYNEKQAHFNWQASILGIEAGSRKLRGFLEGGMGEQGVALIGLRYKF